MGIVLHKTMKKLIFFLSAIVLLTSCLKNNPDASWIKIDKWTLLDNQSIDEGQLTEEFSNVRVLIDGNVIGIFELPIKIPVLLEGEKQIQLFPVIINNGISATKKVYPFVSAFTINENLIPNDTLTISPTTQYLDACNFWIEDFDGATINIQDDESVSTALFEGSDDPAILEPFNGNKFGRIVLSTDSKVWVASTGTNTDGINIPKGVDSFLELDYYLDTDLRTGVLGIGPNGVQENPMIRLNKQTSPSWRKMYIELKEVVSAMTDAGYYKISFRANLPEGVTAGQINIDNVKVVYF